MRKQRLLDSAWLLIEAPETPMHVGILLRFSPPPGAGDDYVRHVLACLRGSASVATPWDLILPVQKFRGLIPVWLHDAYLDMGYHVRLHELPEGAGEAELNASVAELHAQSLSPVRPLWECHVFEGLPGGDFALYVKVHHALLDGVGGIRLMQKMLARSPDDREHAPPWVTPVGDRPAARAAPRAPAPAEEAETTDAQSQAGKPPGLLTSLGRAARELGRAALDRGDALVTPYKGPSCPLNRRISARRAFAAQDCELTRIKRIARLAGGSANDVVLAVCAGALQRLLAAHNALPARPLTAAVPVSIRGRHDNGSGTALSFCLANLGTDVPDMRRRMEAIRASTQRAKEYLGHLPREALVPYTAIMMSPFMLEQFSRVGGRLRPMFNVVISNVPGPKVPLYLEGARLQAAHPLSVLFHGQALNITCVRYVDRINFGFTGCPDTLEGIERLPEHTRAALDELEAAYSFPHQRAQAASPRESAAVAEEEGLPATAG